MGQQSELILVADRAEGGEGWRYEVRDTQLELVGSWSAGGQLLAAPHPSRPIVATVEDGRHAVFELDRADFSSTKELLEL